MDISPYLISSSHSERDVEGEDINAAWKDIELPGLEAVQGSTVDLSLLWKLLEKHKDELEEKEITENNINTTWELVVVQVILLTLLVLVYLAWSVCCASKYFNREKSSSLRKLSSSSSCKVADLPPSYSNLDHHTLGIPVNDYLHPPPEYLHLCADTLQYLDLEQGHNRMAKLSFCNEDGSVPRMERVSVASCDNCDSDPPVVVPVRSERSSISSSSSASSRRQSRNSKVSFSEEVEYSSGSIRRLSNKCMTDKGAAYSRRSTSSSGGTSSVYLSQRKMGSNNKDILKDSLDQELHEKLATIGDDEHATNKITVTAELQAERAAKICDIVLNDK